MPKTPSRWPIHPVPYVDESLLSWIMRIAKIYEIYTWDLLKYEFDIELEVNDLHIIDINPPVNILDKLSQRTGVDVKKIRALTAHSYVPLLLDAVEPLNSENKDNPNSFSDYVNQFNVFPRKSKPYSNEAIDLTMSNNWIPWIDDKRLKNTFVCESCLKEDKEPYLRLYWRFSWMMTCPVHKEILRQVKLYSFTKQIEFYFMQDVERLPSSIDTVYMIDEITMQAVTKGFVKIQAGCLHGGVWLRLLRSLVEELSLQQQNFSHGVLNSIRPLWKMIGLFCREGFYRYKVFEECNIDQQLTLMLVVSKAIQAIFSNQITFVTSGIKLLTPGFIATKDLPSIYTGYITEPSPPKTIGQLMEDVITSMRSDTKVVVEFRNIIRAFDKSGKSLVNVDKSLRNLGIEVIDDYA